MMLAGLEPAIFGSEDHTLSIRPQDQLIKKNHISNHGWLAPTNAIPCDQRIEISKEEKRREEKRRGDSERKRATQIERDIF